MKQTPAYSRSSAPPRARVIGALPGRRARGCRHFRGLCAESSQRAAAGSARVGWRYAHWLVAHATDNGVQRVRFADLEWHADSGRWRAVPPDRAAGTSQVVAEVFH